MPNGKPCKGAHKALGCCQKCYNRLHRPLCWCGRKVRRNGLCDGHWLRSIGVIAGDVEIGGAVGRHQRRPSA